MTKPHACPVCNGTGEKPGFGGAFTNVTINPTTPACPACNGTCIVWEPFPITSSPLMQVMEAEVQSTTYLTVNGNTYEVVRNPITGETNYLDAKGNVIPRTIYKSTGISDEADEYKGTTFSVKFNPDHPDPYNATNSYERQ